MQTSLYIFCKFILNINFRVNLDDLDTLLKDKPSHELTPFQGQKSPQFRMFGQSMSSKTFRRPDGVNVCGTANTLLIYTY